MSTFATNFWVARYECSPNEMHSPGIFGRILCKIGRNPEYHVDITSAKSVFCRCSRELRNIKTRNPGAGSREPELEPEPEPSYLKLDDSDSSTRQSVESHSLHSAASFKFNNRISFVIIGIAAIGTRTAGIKERKEILSSQPPLLSVLT